jgi:hypothetical protein
VSERFRCREKRKNVSAWAYRDEMRLRLVESRMAIAFLANVKHPSLRLMSARLHKLNISQHHLAPPFWDQLFCKESRARPLALHFSTCPVRFRAGRSRELPPIHPNPASSRKARKKDYRHLDMPRKLCCHTTCHYQLLNALPACLLGEGIVFH